MGCTYNVPVLRKQKVQSPVGLLQFEIQEIFIDHKNPIFKNESNGLILSISNHQFEIKSDIVNQCNKKQLKLGFTCFINSFYKEFGRILIVTLYNQVMDKKFKNQTRAFGMVDLNPFILEHPQNDSVKCYINFSKTCIGYLKLKIKFNKLDYCKLKFSVSDFNFQKTESVKRLCYCKVTAGEQILQTDLSPSTDAHKATWSAQQLQFCIPQGLDQIKIEIFQKKSQNDKLIGYGVLNLTQLVNVQKGTLLKISIVDDNNKVGFVDLKILQDEVQEDFCSRKVIAQSMRFIQGKSDKDRQTQASSNYILTQKRLPPIKKNTNVTSLDNIEKGDQNRNTIKKNVLKSKNVSLKLIPEEKEDQIRNSNNMAYDQLQPADCLMIKPKEDGKSTILLPSLQVEL